MTWPTAYRFGMAIAAVDLLTGSGLLALPSAAADVSDPWHGDGRTLGDAVLADVLRKLDALGIEPVEDVDGSPTVADDLGDGRQVVGLYVRDAVSDGAGVKALSEAFAACRAALSVG